MVEIKYYLEKLGFEADRLEKIFIAQNIGKIIIYKDWTAHDVLAHLVMWHENFAQIIQDLINENVPKYLRGSLAEINENGVIMENDSTISNLKKRFIEANIYICENIQKIKIDKIKYRYGSRNYSINERLKLSVDHVAKHLKDIEFIVKRINSD